MQKEEVIAAIRECAGKLGRNPTRNEVFRMTKVRTHALQRHFGAFGKALAAAGLEPRGFGHRIDTASLFRDWARAARKVGKLPSVGEYQLEGGYSLRPYMARFKAWNFIPQAFLKHAQANNLGEEWADVVRMVREQQEELQERQKAPVRRRPAIMPDRPGYGPPLAMEGMGHEPVNEQGVILLFGMMARRLGFVVTHIQAGFPDCEALREIEPGRWQRVRIEFEHESRNFVLHGHDKNGCDLIVCWVHNWEEAPEGLEVIELREAMKRIG